MNMMMTIITYILVFICSSFINHHMNLHYIYYYDSLANLKQRSIIQFYCPYIIYKNMYNLGNKTISLWFTYMKKKTDLYFSTYTLGGRVAQKWLYRENIIQNFFFCTIYLASICVTQTQNQKNFVRHFRRSSMILGPVPVVIISCRIFPIRGSSS